MELRNGAPQSFCGYWSECLSQGFQPWAEQVRDSAVVAVHAIITHDALHWGHGVDEFLRLASDYVILWVTHSSDAPYWRYTWENKCRWEKWHWLWCLALYCTGQPSAVQFLSNSPVSLDWVHKCVLLFFFYCIDVPTRQYAHTSFTVIVSESGVLLAVSHHLADYIPLVRPTSAEPQVESPRRILSTTLVAGRLETTLTLKTTPVQCWALFSRQVDQPTAECSGTRGRWAQRGSVAGREKLEDLKQNVRQNAIHTEKYRHLQGP